ncbi:MAG: aldo/keto reductase [Isosphaeraceae bacterium]|nr:aldo/keto reductase [Isosphaeraceae bacterium]
MEGCNGSRGGSRRRFLQTSAAGAALAATPSVFGAPQGKEGDAAVPRVTLGRTGQKVTKLGMGTSWALSPSFVQLALFSGVRFIDTSESYENTVSEKVIGEVLERTKMRKDVYLVTKNAAFRRASGPNAAGVFEEHLEASLERLQTDYVDCYYLHGVAGDQIKVMRDPSVRAAFEKLKKSGKIRYIGLSCHDAMLPEIMEAAVELGWFDQMMIKYNFRDVGGRDRHDDLQRAIDKASKANIGLVAMKTQGGAVNFPDKMQALQAKGFKKEVAAIKTVWQDERMQVVVSEMTNRGDLRENIAASREELTQKEARLLEEYRLKTAKLYCHGCGHLCETASKGVQVSTVLRYMRYYEVYGKREAARSLYQSLPAAARVAADANLDVIDAACPHGLAVGELLRRADRVLA